jgi:hypothetical protein
MAKPNAKERNELYTIKFAWMARVSENRHVTHLQARIANYIALEHVRIAWTGDLTFCVPHQRVAEALDITRTQTVGDALIKLKRLGLIRLVKERERGYRNEANAYELVPPGEEYQQPDVGTEQVVPTEIDRSTNGNSQSTNGNRQEYQQKSTPGNAPTSENDPLIGTTGITGELQGGARARSRPSPETPIQNPPSGVANILRTPKRNAGHAEALASPMRSGKTGIPKLASPGATATPTPLPCRTSAARRRSQSSRHYSRRYESWRTPTSSTPRKYPTPTHRNA